MWAEQHYRKFKHNKDAMDMLIITTEGMKLN